MKIRFLLILPACVSLMACQSFHPREIYRQQASVHPFAVTGDGVSVLVRAMDSEESKVAFDGDIFSEHIQPLVISISNHSSVPLEFDATTIPHYIPADQVYRRTSTSPATVLGTGVLGAALTPVVVYACAVADSSSTISEPERLLSPTAFSISGVVWGTYTLFSMIDLSTRVNPQREQYLRKISTPLLTIIPGEDAQTVVFTDIPGEREEREPVQNTTQTLPEKMITIELIRPTGESMIFEVTPVF